MQAGISRAKPLCGTPSKISPPIGCTQIKRVLVTSSDPKKVALRATACTGFFCLGEVLPESGNASNRATDLPWDDAAVNEQVEPQKKLMHDQSGLT